MPRLRTLTTRKPPEGWDDVLPQLEEFQSQMRDAVNEPHEGKRRNEATWPITKIHYERSRYIYELFYKKKAISRELYDFLLQEKYADAALIAKWKKPGYEYLCSLQAIDKRNSNFNTTAVCRVPLHLRKSGGTGPSVSTGCISCASQEAGRLGGPIWPGARLPTSRGRSARRFQMAKMPSWRQERLHCGRVRMRAYETPRQMLCWPAQLPCVLARAPVPCPSGGLEMRVTRSQHRQPVTRMATSLATRRLRRTAKRSPSAWPAAPRPPWAAKPRRRAVLLPRTRSDCYNLSGVMLTLCHALIAKG
eukprot:TRINITY_DN9218_c0_g1_i1.p1 TRINITY_DN9218_c0_g1~~TRINITY_DN9218_c0_g1_i1.p1  ORF type:complete len:305 (-),score=56.78 TRINITY_DN9218_c0_g1_i1:57-971(-)